MTTIVLWGESDHETRAKSLATAYATTARSVNDGASKVAGLDKLVLWGHGEISKFCGLRAPDFVKLVGDWKAANDGLTTVEMLTCNARHRQRGSDSCTEQVVTELCANVTERLTRSSSARFPLQRPVAARPVTGRS